eukprot:g1946.t1
MTPLDTKKLSLTLRACGKKGMRDDSLGGYSRSQIQELCKAFKITDRTRKTASLVRDLLRKQERELEEKSNQSIGVTGKLVLSRALGETKTKKKVKTKETTYQTCQSIKVGFQMTDSHQSRALNGGHAHELIRFWRWSDPLRNLDSRDPNFLWGTNERGNEEDSIQKLQRKIFKTSKKDKSLRLKKIRGKRSVVKEALPAMLEYFDSDIASSPWYEAKALDWPVFPPVAANEGCRGIDFFLKATSTSGKKDFEKKCGNGLGAGDVCQGDIGDCYVACALSLLAEFYPYSLRKRIKKKKDGTFSVAMWDQRHGSHFTPGMENGAFQITVSPSFYVHRRMNRKGAKGTLLYARTKNGSYLWPSILEKAWLKYRSAQPENEGSYEEIANEQSFDPGDVLHAFLGLDYEIVGVLGDYGKSSFANWCRLSEGQQNTRKDRIWDILCDALLEGRATAIGTSTSEKIRSKKKKASEQDYILGHHSYLILDAGESSSDGKFVMLRNPQGEQTSPFLQSTVPPTGVPKELAQDGVFLFPFDLLFNGQFTSISYISETSPKYPKRVRRFYRRFVIVDGMKWVGGNCNDDHEEERKEVKRSLF